MKQTPIYDEIQKQMAPGVITLDGFLGPDKRKLVDIIATDEKLVHYANTTVEAIAERMQYFRDLGLRGLGEYISIEPHFEVCVDSVRGKLPSPFGGPGMYDKVNTTVVNRELDKAITYTDLHIHLIRDHGFFQGAGSRYRLEPLDLVKILEILPNKA
ncbi:MAG: hypothetical protein WC207_03845 [Sphaerochaetaceae bacterium]|jgi:hypothetical protein|nr:hypothetical protein [Spirochaetales bacterium]